MSRTWCLLLLAIGLASVACAGPARVGQDPTASDKDTEAKYGGTLIMGMSDTPENTHVYASNSRGNGITLNHYYEPFLGYDQKGEWRVDLTLMPLLAESWQQPNDTTYLFKVRQGAKWQDGRPFTVDDALWSLNYLRDPANRFRDRTFLIDVQEITASADGTLRMTVKEPTPTFLRTLREIQIMPRHVFEAGGGEALANKSTSTGPFELVSMERTARTKFKRYAGYWGKDEKGRQLPFLDGIEIIHNMDASSQRAAFAAGQNDLHSFQDRTELNAFTGRTREVKVIDFYYSNGPGWMINVSRPPFNNADVRKAVNLVINRPVINDNFSSGEGLYATPIIPAMKTGWGVSQEELLKRPGWRTGQEKSKDLEEARQLLQKAGLTPEQVEFRAIATGSWTTAPQAEQAVGQWKQFGFKVRYEPLDGATFTREERDANWDLRWQVQLSQDDFTRTGVQHIHSKGGSNFGGFNDPDADRLIEGLRKAMTPEDQKRLGKQVQALILDKVYMMPIVSQRLFHVIQPWVYDYRTGRSTQADLNGTTPFTWIDVDKLPSGRK